MATVLVLVAGAVGASQFIRRDRPPDAVAVAASNSPTASPSPLTSAATTAPTSTATASEDFAQVFLTVRSGVIRIDTSTCDGGGIGTGFLVDDDLIVTAAHVVDGAASLGLTFGDESDPSVASGVVVGIDRAADMAMIRADRKLKGHVFRFGASIPEVGQEVIAIGFPKGEPMTLTRGVVSGLNRRITIDGETYGNLIQTDAAINPGNSGGPMVDMHGSVQGVADAVRADAQGIAYAIPADTAEELSSSWHDNTDSVVSPSCDQPTAPDTTTDLNLQSPSEDPLAVDVTTFFNGYFTAINQSDYERVWAMLHSRLRPSDPGKLSDSLSSTIDFGMEVHSVQQESGGTVRAHVSFISTQAPDQGPKGQTCTVWDLDYSLTPTGEPWQIRKAVGHGGAAPYRSC